MILSEWRINYYGKNKKNSSLISMQTPKSNEKQQIYEGNADK